MSNLRHGITTMATLILAHGACVSRMTPGEQRLAELLEHKLDDNYLFWYEEPVGGNRLHANFKEWPARWTSGRIISRNRACARRTWRCWRPASTGTR